MNYGLYALLMLILLNPIWSKNNFNVSCLLYINAVVKNYFEKEINNHKPKLAYNSAQSDL